MQNCYIKFLYKFLQICKYIVLNFYIKKDLSKDKDVKGRICNPIYCQS